MVILDLRHRGREAECARQLDLVFRLVRTVTAAALAFEELHRGQRVLARKLGHIIHNAVLVQKLGGFEFAAGLVFQHKFHMAVERIQIILHRNVDIREHLEVGLPADGGAGLFAGRGRFDKALPGAGFVFALFKVQGVLEPVADDRHIHIFRGVLGRAGTQAVKAERKLIVLPSVVLVFAARVQLAEHQLPVIPLLAFIPLHRNAAAVVRDLDRAIRVSGGDDLAAIALACFVNRVGEDLEHRVLTALQPIRPENHAWALTDAVRALERGNAFITVRRFCFAHIRS